MARVTTLQVGRLRVHALDAGRQQLDGGAMFGVVPKPLWERRIAADARNRIPLAMRCLLVEHEDGLTLIDTGVGNKDDARFRDIYGIDNAGENGRTWLEDALAELGYRADDVAMVINTHLHFDHAGGNTFVDAGDAERRAQIAFPRARYVMHARELEWALHPNERTQASYLPDNFVPVQTAGRVDLIDGVEHEVRPGIRALVTPGHTPWHMVLLIESDGETLLYPADTIPTAHHLPLPWVMGYDVEPLRTLESKRDLFRRARGAGWQIVFEHDAHTAAGRLIDADRGMQLVPA